jgi:hypothetical protein
VVAALAAAGAAAVLARPRRTPRRRLSALSADTPVRARRRPEPRLRQHMTLRSPAVRSALAGVTLLAGLVALGPLPGVLVGGGLAVGVLLATGSPERVDIDAAAVSLGCDLVAACLGAGTVLPDAVAAAGTGVGGSLGELCASVAAGLRAGATPEQAWAQWLADPRLAPVARTAVRTAHSGAATADELRRTAARLRAQRSAALQQRVRRASVWVVVPLGLCFLPAFVLVAVVPLVVGLLPSLS